LGGFNFAFRLHVLVVEGVRFASLVGCVVFPRASFCPSTPVSRSGNFLPFVGAMLIIIFAFDKQSKAKGNDYENDDGIIYKETYIG